MTTPGAVHVKVTTEVGYCPFCRRTRNLRREERQLGGLVRTNLECESCHRTLSSTMAPPAPPVEEPAAPAAELETEPVAEKPRPKKPAARKPAAKKKSPAPRTKSSTRKPKS